MSAADESPAGQPTYPGEDPQAAVARARENVLRGHGPGLPKAEYDRYKRERPTLGALPSPLARELVHLQTAKIRSGLQRGVDDTAVQNQLDRVREVWSSKPVDHPRSLALAQTLDSPFENAPQPLSRSAAEPSPLRAEPPGVATWMRYVAAAALGGLAGAGAATVVLHRAGR